MVAAGGGGDRGRYRTVLGKRGDGGYRAATEAFLAADGDPELAARDVVLIVSAAARDHAEWSWRPARKRIAREERW